MVVLVIAVFFFFVRIVCLPFSCRIRSQVRRHPWLHGVWGLAAVIYLIVFLIQLNSALRQPHRPPYRYTRIADCTNAVVKATVRNPSVASMHIFILSVPQKHSLEFSGRVELREGDQQIHAVEFNSATIHRTQWMENGGASLAFELMSLPARYRLEPNRTYEVYVLFSNLPPEGSALWYWRRQFQNKRVEGGEAQTQKPTSHYSCEPETKSL